MAHPQKAPSFPTKWRNLEELADFLEEQFQPQAIKVGQPLDDAHHAAGASALAGRIVATIRSDIPEEDED